MFKKMLIGMSMGIVCMTVTIHAQTQMEMNADAGKTYNKADKELNAVYKKLVAKLSDAEKSALKTQQRNWIKIKESDCKKEADEYEGGSMAPMILYNCLEEKTIQRTKELRAMLRGR